MICIGSSHVLEAKHHNGAKYAYMECESQVLAYDTIAYVPRYNSISRYTLNTQYNQKGQQK